MTRFLHRPDAPRLAYEVYEPSVESRGRILITPGFSEPLKRYGEVCPVWQQAGFQVVIYDLRGQGDSEGRPGHIEHFDDYLGDASAILDATAVSGEGPTPTFLFGHSLGALISIHLALQHPSEFSGLALSSPFFGLKVPAARWQVTLARITTELTPTLSQPTRIVGSWLTRDAQRARMIDNDPKRIPRITVRWFTETQRAQAELRKQAGSLKVRTFCLAAEEERIADPDVTREIFRRLECDAVLETLPGSYHELHQELERVQNVERFRDCFLTWTAAA